MSHLEQDRVDGYRLAVAISGHNTAYDGRREDRVVCSPVGSRLHNISVLLVFEGESDCGVQWHAQLKVK
jgi:hypothetical protein